MSGFGFLKKMTKIKRGKGNLVLFHLCEAIRSKGYAVKLADETYDGWQFVIVENGLCIAPELTNCREYYRGAASVQLNFLVFAEKQNLTFFEMLAGVGKNLAAAFANGMSLFLLMFDFLCNALEGRTVVDASLRTETNDKAAFWNCYFSELMLQGKANHDIKADKYFELLKEAISQTLSDKKIYFLKIYTSKQEDGTIIAQCILNGEPFDIADNLLERYTKNLSTTDFWGEKQYLLFVPVE